MKHFARCIGMGIIWLCWLGQGARAAEFRWGLAARAEFNRYIAMGVAGDMRQVYAQKAQPAVGLYSALDLGRRFFIDASVLLGRARYAPNYTEDKVVFMDADIRFTQVNISLNLVLNPGSEKASVYLFGGVQSLYRRWGEERYTNGIIANSYWQRTRNMLQAGVGVKCNIGKCYLQPFAGIRYAGAPQLVYDTRVNQVYIGLIVMKGAQWHRHHRSRYNRCPADF